MSRYIGLDAHGSSFALGAMAPMRTRVGSNVVETNARSLIETVRRIPEPRHICLEEGTLSEWLYEVLSCYAQKVVAGVVVGTLGVQETGWENGRSAGRRLGLPTGYELPDLTAGTCTRGRSPPRGRGYLPAFGAL